MDAHGKIASRAGGVSEDRCLTADGVVVSAPACDQRFTALRLSCSNQKALAARDYFERLRELQNGRTPRQPYAETRNDDIAGQPLRLRHLLFQQQRYGR